MHLQSCSAHSRSISNNYCSVVKLAYLFTLVASEAFASSAEPRRCAWHIMSLIDLKELGRDTLIIGLELHDHLIACIGLIGYS